MDYWVQFAKTGNPNLDSQQQWHTYTTSEDQHLTLDKTIQVETKRRCDACDLLDKLLEQRRGQVATASP